MWGTQLLSQLYPYMYSVHVHAYGGLRTGYMLHTYYTMLVRAHSLSVHNMINASDDDSFHVMVLHAKSAFLRQSYLACVITAKSRNRALLLKS